MRVEKGLQMDAINPQKFRLEPPRKGENASVEEWEDSVKNAMSQLENQYTRIINLELMLRFSKNSWIINCYKLEWYKERLKNCLEAIEEEIQQINRQRKLDQVKFIKMFIPTFFLTLEIHSAFLSLFLNLNLIQFYRGSTLVLYKHSPTHTR